MRKLNTHFFIVSLARWSDFYNKNGKIVVRLRELVLDSDERIVAILSHEMHELNALRELFEHSDGVMTSARLHDLIEPSSRSGGILHLEAWVIADELVRLMRGGK